MRLALICQYFVEIKKVKENSRSGNNINLYASNTWFSNFSVILALDFAFWFEL